MTTRLQLSRSFSFTSDFATKSAAILAQRRKGKTFTGSVLAEECAAAEIPFVALDPTGAWWGLRASADGKRAGLPVYVFGGEHASDPDLPLEPTSGKLIAEFVVDYPGYYVIDFKSFESKADERRFATDFAERLYRLKGQPGKDFVMHLFVDEADMFVPQRIPSGDQRMVGAFEAIVRRGGIRGLGTTLISQRAAVVNKNVLEMIDILIVLRTVGPNDREAIRKYVVANGTPEEVSALMSSVSSLALGEAWVYEPGAEPSIFERIQVRARRTFNSSATPKAGEKRIEPKELSDVELTALRERMASTIERAKESDPSLLQQRVRELERELQHRSVTEPTVERIEVPVVPEGFIESLADVSKMLERTGNELSLVNDALSEMRSIAYRLQENKDAPRVIRQQTGSTPAPRTSRQPSAPSDGALTGMQRKILTALAQMDRPLSQTQLLLLTGYRVGGAWNTAMSRLRQQEYISITSPTTATEQGYAALGTFTPLPTGPALYDHWKDSLGQMAGRIMDTLSANPAGLYTSELLERTEYRVGGAWNTALSRLRKLDIITSGQPIRFTDEFAEAIR